MSREYFACTRAADACGEGREIHIHARSPEEAASLDDLLWTFRDISFLPHCVIEGDDSRSEPITIGWQERAPGGDVLINLAAEVPPFAESFAHILEPVPGDPELKQEARARFRHYRDRGLDPVSHEVNEENGRP